MGRSRGALLCCWSALIVLHRSTLVAQFVGSAPGAQLPRALARFKDAAAIASAGKNYCRPWPYVSGEILHGLGRAAGRRSAIDDVELAARAKKVVRCFCDSLRFSRRERRLMPVSLVPAQNRATLAP